MEADAAKTFGIGLSKTGTSSLASALELLGYRTKDYMGVVEYRRGDLSCLDLATIEQYDALTDTPIPSFYRELDRRYPGSKFILTVRERAGWVKSCRKQFTERLAAKQNDAHRRLFVDLYGTDVFDERKFVDGYESFVGGVLDYFRSRPQDLLVFDPAGGDGWEKLCRFLGKPVSDLPFPKANVTQIRWLDIAAVVSIAREAGNAIVVDCRGNPRGPAPAQARGDAAARADLADVAGRMVNRVLYSIGGGRGAAARAEDRACWLIVRRLKRLTPQIPVVSRFTEAQLASERTKLNHVWMVDVLVETEGPGAPGRESTINIALVEDGRPIYGVVCAPVPDIVYYAKLGEGSFKSVNGGSGQTCRPGEIALGHDEASTRQRRGLDDRGEGRKSTGDASRASRPGHALAICRVVDGEAASYRSPAPVMEWEIAAAHAIARSAGKRVCDGEFREELKYNRKVPTFPSVAVR